MAAPVVLFPSSAGQVVETGSEVQVTWQPAQAQFRYAVRIRVNAGAYQWWDGYEWFAYEVVSAGTRTTERPVLPAVHGDVVQLSVASEGATGPLNYTTERLVHVRDAPVLEFVSQPGTVPTTSPTVTVESSDLMASFTLTLWPLAVTLEPGWTYSKEDPRRIRVERPVSEGLSVTFERLSNNTDYVVYGVAATDYYAGYRLRSDPVTLALRVEALPPAAPTITVAPDGPMVEVTVSTGSNRAGASQASFDSVSGWQADNATIEQTPLFGVAALTTGAGQVTADGSGNPVVTPTDEWSCVPGQVYSSTVAVRDGGTVRTARIRRRWYNSSDTLLGTVDGTAV